MIDSFLKLPNNRFFSKKPFPVQEYICTPYNTMYVNRSTDISSFSNCLLCKTAYIVLNEKNHLDKILVLIENVKYTAIQYVLYIFFFIFHHITSFCDILMK